MSEPSRHDQPVAQPVHTGAHAQGHPSVKEYVRIGAILAVLTGLEVATSYGIDGALQIILLMLGMVLKFAIVVLWFMHLKFDSRMFSRFFLMGLAGATTLYLVVLMVFRVFLR